MFLNPIFLQVNELSQDVWYILGAAIVLILAIALTRYYQRKQKTREDLPPRTATKNTSNYNIDNTGIDDKHLDDLNPREANEVVDKMKESDYIPSEEEFHELRKAKKAQ